MITACQHFCPIYLTNLKSNLLKKIRRKTLPIFCKLIFQLLPLCKNEASCMDCSTKSIFVKFCARALFLSHLHLVGLPIYKHFIPPLTTVNCAKMKCYLWTAVLVNIRKILCTCAIMAHLHLVR